MERSYEVYIEGRLLVIADAPPDAVIPAGMQVMPIDSEHRLDEALERLEQPGNARGLWLHPKGIGILWDLFSKRYKFVQAAGGAVQDERGRLLVIKRLGKWDLPKGKVNEGEGIPEAALREVEEECGIDELKIIEPLAVTWHTYERKGKQHLKRTDWFLMEGSSKKQLTPETEEDIEEVRWMTREEVTIMKSQTYPSLVKVVECWESK
ncbi:MAG: NUDIX domain-containing protein [Bacteroidota bacterium]|nr:NUDIX domain-containing protein [Bacteroidota bacterium]